MKHWRRVGDWVDRDSTVIEFRERPGCSSIAYGMAEELGPFHILNDEKTLYAWNQGHYVPQLSQAISRYNSAGNEKTINLKGYMFDKALDMASEDHGEIDPYSILTPPCSAIASMSNQKKKRWRMVGHIGRTYYPCTEKHSVVYFNQPEVPKALHVHSEKVPSKWDTCR
ncbi:hypothetical protein RHMOL_Rhmol09G0002800 [Rhododendron molle]|uniref:Uncharacterized protein n=1 Tax=Rhododendron molle TaxID=49168 RepID=A0ACC0M872_RHOML|nr:hypothetical protein RHMOL_Rhmol09G0002800 [Rhododendron molle]